MPARAIGNKRTIIWKLPASKRAAIELYVRDLARKIFKRWPIVIGSVGIYLNIVDWCMNGWVTTLNFASESIGQEGTPVVTCIRTTTGMI